MERGEHAWNNKQNKGTEKNEIQEKKTYLTIPSRGEEMVAGGAEFHTADVSSIAPIYRDILIGVHVVLLVAKHCVYWWGNRREATTKGSESNTNGE